MRWVNGFEKMGAAVRRNLDGRSSGLVAVGDRVSRSLKTSNSVILFEFCVTESFG